MASYILQGQGQRSVVQRPVELNASDGLHPSDAGYLLWYRELQAQAHLSDRLRKVEQ